MRLLLIEDDQMLGKALKNALESNNYVTDWVDDFESSCTALKTAEFDAILLDINLPDKSGLEILKNLRAKKNYTPVLILTADSSIQQKVDGLDFGADDYLAKPFDLNELLARVRSILRRAKGRASSILSYQNITLDSLSHVVTKNNETIFLPPKEFLILQSLLDNIGKVISRSKLESQLYSWDNSVESNAVEVHIHHLRKKLGQDFIKTIRGVGYIISATK